MIADAPANRGRCRTHPVQPALSKHRSYKGRPGGIRGTKFSPKSPRILSARKSLCVATVVFNLIHAVAVRLRKTS
jgi:hypothetical protein